MHLPRKPMHLGYFALAGVLVAAGSPAAATLVGVEYFDEGGLQPGEGGPLWRGFVDTEADTLSIFFWTELPGHGADFRTPIVSPSAPLVWQAQSLSPDGQSIVSFDVPESFGVGGVTIDSTWGFVSPIDASQMQWVEGPFTPAVSVIRPGWGAFINETQSPAVLDASADETSLPFFPLAEPAGNNPFPTGQSTGAVVTTFSMSAIPEAGAVGVLTALATLGVASAGRRS